MRATRFYTQGDLPVVWPPSEEVQKRAIEVRYYSDFSGPITLSTNYLTEEYYEVKTDFATFDKIAHTPAAPEFHDFTNDEGRSFTVHISQIRELVSEAYRNEAIRAMEEISVDGLLGLPWVRTLVEKNLPV